MDIAILLTQIVADNNGCIAWFIVAVLAGYLSGKRK